MLLNSGSARRSKKPALQPPVAEFYASTYNRGYSDHDFFASIIIFGANFFKKGKPKIILAHNDQA
jgi:hypothetical protein